MTKIHHAALFIGLVGVGLVVWRRRVQATAPAGGDSDSSAFEGPPMNFGLPSAGVRALATAIAVAEGFQDQDGNRLDQNLPARLHNPGDLKWGTPTLTPFTNDGAGWQALHEQLQRIEAGRSRQYTLDMTFREMGATWAPTDDDNELDAWATNVVAALQRYGYTELTLDSPIREVLKHG